MAGVRGQRQDNQGDTFQGGGLKLGRGLEMQPPGPWLVLSAAALRGEWHLSIFGKGTWVLSSSLARPWAGCQEDSAELCPWSSGEQWLLGNPL